ncbi:uncharacterized protein LOC116125929 [Pistacia vera]|uniref:Uncharacterized protein n=1 Tax=Pistacia integerrima TaxID=434235 RepID=A0ACC0XS14_9ROSI|nr:uncharacterized protein LOC116120133 [Pistacia vera]XP_031267503.1 uncharacterized protein LOC116125929 [Pistacia vera]KAJ0024109.1 hypothetical protein Pint_07284 [Pistacia integerrima]
MVPVYKNPDPCAFPSLSPTSNLNYDKLPTQPSPRTPTPSPSRHDPATASSSMLAVAIGSWLRSRRSRYLFLLLCSPLLLPLLCACFPFLCAAEVFIRFWRRRKRQDEERLRRCEEGCCGCEFEDEREVGLLQRYLEDQLMLVGSMYDCDVGDDADDHGDYTVPLLS